MKLKLTLILVLLTALTTVSGCSKKEEPSAPSPQDSEQQAGDILDKAADAVESATETVKESLSMGIDMEKTVSDLQAEAAKMDIETLKELALKYKDAIAEKQVEWKSLTDQLAAIPAAEKMGEEAKALQEELNAVADSSQQLMQRFNMYVNAIKDKGEDVEGLSL